MGLGEWSGPPPAQGLEETSRAPAKVSSRTLCPGASYCLLLPCQALLGRLPLAPPVLTTPSRPQE